MNATFYMGQPPHKRGPDGRKQQTAPCEYVRITMTDGNVADRAATPADRQRYKHEYAAFLAEQKARTPATPKLVKKG